MEQIQRFESILKGTPYIYCLNSKLLICVILWYTLFVYQIYLYICFVSLFVFAVPFEIKL